ncbi:Nicotinamide-nucleotide amidohydrolase PncC [Halomonadaceae bacterium LMG 33818]|uniref:CinA family protein n=1 Tax=Cernens ardua TaxID=3402176 RepID=UPI003EDBC492
MTSPDTADSTRLIAFLQQHAALATIVGQLASDKQWQLTTAESCTGGWVAEAITAISGSSQWFETGYVTYSNATKQRLLGVNEYALATKGAVSAEVVEQMVKGACEESGADLGVAISGIAGPGGGSVEKPVGTVWFAWGNCYHQTSRKYLFEGDRTGIRAQAVCVALQGFIEYLKR